MKKENVVIKQSCHSQEFLLGIYDVLSNYVNKKKALCMKDKYAGDPRQNSSGMTTLLITAYGFTLIELLVVVLIIGILAAVAVPQYQKAVEKSRFANYRTLAGAVATAVEAFYLANGIWPTSFDELSVELPADMNIQNAGGLCRKNNKFFCCIIGPNGGGIGGSIKCGDNDYHLIYSRGYAAVDGTPKKGLSCQAKEEKYKAICKSMSVEQEPRDTAVNTPDGWIAGYFAYELD